MNNAPMESFFHTLKNRNSSITSIMQHVRESQTWISLLYIEGLLQSNASPLRHRLYQADRDGAKSSLTLSIFFGGRSRVCVGLT